MRERDPHFGSYQQQCGYWLYEKKFPPPALHMKFCLFPRKKIVKRSLPTTPPDKSNKTVTVVVCPNVRGHNEIDHLFVLFVLINGVLLEREMIVHPIVNKHFSFMQKLHCLVQNAPCKPPPK